MTLWNEVFNRELATPLESGLARTFRRFLVRFVVVMSVATLCFLTVLTFQRPVLFAFWLLGLTAWLLLRAWKESRFAQAMLDGVVTMYSLALAHAFRFDGLSSGDVAKTQHFLPYVVLAQVGFNFLLGVYRDPWRYYSVISLVRHTAAASLVALLLLAHRFAYPRVDVALSIGVIVVNWFVVVGAMTSLRILRRIWLERRVERVSFPGTRVRILVAGASAPGLFTVGEIVYHDEFGIDVCGFVDDDEKRQGMSFHGVKVLGRTTDIPVLVEALGIDEVVILMPDASQKVLEQIEELCLRSEVKARVMPRDVRSLIVSSKTAWWPAA